MRGVALRSACPRRGCLRCGSRGLPGRVGGGDFAGQSGAAANGKAERMSRAWAPGRRGERWRSGLRWRRRAGRGRGSRRLRALPLRPGGWLRMRIPTPRAVAISLSVEARPPRVRSRRQWISSPRRAELRQAPRAGGVADDGCVEFQPFAHGEDGDAVRAQVAAHDHGVAGAPPTAVR